MRAQLEEQLRKTRERADQIKNTLAPWRGMTWSEARKHGWGPEQENLQKELWLLGYQIIQLENDLAREEGG